MTLAGQLERSAQIPLQALIAIGHEVQTTLDQCERLASKSPQLKGEREVVADLVIGYDLAVAQNQPKFTADWLTHRMSATHTPAAAASKKRAMQELKDQRALGGKDSYQSISAWQQTAPTSPWYSPTHQSGWGRGPAYSPTLHAGWGGGAHTAPPPPSGFQPGHYTPPTRGRGAGRGKPRGGRGDAGRGTSGGGGSPMSLVVPFSLRTARGLRWPCTYERTCVCICACECGTHVYSTRTGPGRERTCVFVCACECGTHVYSIRTGPGYERTCVFVCACECGTHVCSTRTSEPCPNLGLYLWCRGTCVRFAR